MRSLDRHENQEFQFEICEDEYWDVNLTQTGNLCVADSPFNLIAEINLFNYVDTSGACVESTSGITWPGAVTSSGVTLYNAGMTEVDNGHISFDKDTIEESEFLDIYENTVITLPADDRLYLCKIDTNHKRYSTELNLSRQEFNGGFLQGAFKTKCGQYQVLPDTIDNTLNFSFLLSTDNITNTSGVTINDVNSDTDGIFFYIGTRAENKWWGYYNVDESEFKDGTIEKIRDIEYSGDTAFSFHTAEGYDIRIRNIEIVETDNKHLTYHRGPGGRMAYQGNTDEKDVFWYDNRDYNDNLHLLVNRTASGATAHDIIADPDKYKNGNNTVYSVKSDLFNNALAFRVKKDGSVGFRYIEKQCNEDETASIRVVDEYSKPGMFQFAQSGETEWNEVTVSLRPVGTDEMRVYIYVGSSLVYVSSDLQRLNLRALNDIYEKQELVPYTISLGGGTQGLGDVVYDTYKELPAYKLPLERYFAGSFIGKIGLMRIYEGFMEYGDIINATGQTI